MANKSEKRKLTIDEVQDSVRGLSFVDGMKNVGSYYLSVDYDLSHLITRQANLNEKYDGDDTYTEWFIKGTFTVDKNMDYKNVPVNFEPSSGKTYWLLYAVYSTGDSYSYNENGSIEFIDVFQDKEKAKENFEVLKAVSKGGVNFEECSNYPYECALKLEDGRPYKYYIPWNGYFESLSYLKIVPVTLKTGPTDSGAAYWPEDEYTFRP